MAKTDVKPSLMARLKAKEHAWYDSIGTDISTAEARKKALFHFNYIDHGILRVWWKNFHQIAEGLYRSNQPAPERLAEFKSMGIKTIINLRGTSQHSQYLFEKEACSKLDLRLINLKLSARDLVSREQMLALITLFDTLEKPAVMHCKSGSDRTGFAAVLYLHLYCGETVEAALRQLSWKYLHLKKSKNGILDLFFEAYLRDNAKTPIGLRDWIKTVYDPVPLRLEFKRLRGK